MKNETRSESAFPSTDLNRRQFLRKAGIGVGVAALAPNIVTAQKTEKQVVIGDGEHKYEIQHNWAQLPDKYSWQTTHNVAHDSDGCLYVIHEGRADQKDHPSIFVFDPDGKFIKAFGSQFQGGGHGLEVREEDGEQFIYVTGYQHLKNFAKLTLDGEVVWEKHAPMESKKYAEGEAIDPKKIWGRDRFMPTNFAFHSDGGFFLADGYGAYTIHRYDKDGNWKTSIGSPGKGDGQFNLPHGVWIDDRPGKDPSLVVADRANARLQWFTLDGKHLETLGGFILPANIDTHGELMLVPDLSARVTLLGPDNKVVAHLGEDPEWRKQVTKDRNKLRREPAGWVAGKFLHPHDACFDAEGNIFVAEWVQTGRVSRLRKLS